MSKQSDAKAAQGGPIIKFRTDSQDRIERVEVLHETEQSVFLAASNWGGKTGERREAKVTNWQRYHDTLAAAHAYLLKRATSEVLTARLALERANGKLGNIKGMKPPKD